MFSTDALTCTALVLSASLFRRQPICGAPVLLAQEWEGQDRAEGAAMGLSIGMMRWEPGRDGCWAEAESCRLGEPWCTAGCWCNCEGFYIKERSHIKAAPSGSQERYRLPKALGALTYFVMRPRSL